MNTGMKIHTLLLSADGKARSASTLYCCSWHLLNVEKTGDYGWPPLNGSTSLGHRLIVSVRSHDSDPSFLSFMGARMSPFKTLLNPVYICRNPVIDWNYTCIGLCARHPTARAQNVSLQYNTVHSRFSRLCIVASIDQHSGRGIARAAHCPLVPVLLSSEFR